VTLVVGLSCEEGIVLASDSQVSSGTTRSYGQKLWAVQEAGVVFGLSGAESTMQLLCEELLAITFSESTLRSVRRTLGQLASAILDSEYARVRNTVGIHDWKAMPVAGIVMGVFADNRPRLLITDEYGTVSEQRGFVAAGTGAPFGQHAATVFRVIRAKHLSLHQTKMLAFRVVQDAIEIAGPTVGLNGPIQMATLSLSGGNIVASLLDNDDLAIAEAVQSWILAEGERFLDHAPPGDG
jgi:20S proteasome alpha/beta subunit